METPCSYTHPKESSRPLENKNCMLTYIFIHWQEALAGGILSQTWYLTAGHLTMCVNIQLLFTCHLSHQAHVMKVILCLQWMARILIERLQDPLRKMLSFQLIYFPFGNFCTVSINDPMTVIMPGGQVNSGRAVLYCF